MSHLPIITCARGGASEAVSKRLSKSIRHSLAGADSLFSSSEHVSRSLFGAQRPLLLILERSDDLVAVMRHSIVYQDLVADLLTYVMIVIFLVENRKYVKLNSKKTGTV